MVGQTAESWPASDTRWLVGGSRLESPRVGWVGVPQNWGSVLRFRFLSRVSILTRDIDIANMSVRLSVRYVPV